MFNSTYGGYSLADIAAVTGGGNNKNSGNSDGMWGEGGWWIILLFLFIGWGRNGYGNGNGSNGGNGGGTDVVYANPYFTGFGSACATKEDVRAAVDQQTLISKLDQQTYGLADSTYALNNAITNGFNGIDNAICTLGYQNQAGFTAIGNQLAQCCCDTRAAISDVKTQNLMNTNALSSQLAQCC